MANQYMEILVLLSVTKVHSERCPLDSADEMQVFPPPPKFPDFMAAFEGTILRLGLTHLRQDDGLTLSKTCPESVNWSEFNSRLCGEEPFDLEGFCSPDIIDESTIASLIDPLLVEVTSKSNETSTEFRFLSLSKIYPVFKTTEMRTSSSPGLSHHNETHPITVGTAQPSGHKDLEDGFKDNGTKEPHDFEDVVSKDLGTEDLVPSPDVCAVSDTTGVAEALYQGDGASIAIGVGCGLTLLFLIIVVVIIKSYLSHTRGRGCRQLMNPLFKVFQRQTSDAILFTRSSPNQPSTPLEEIRTNGGILTDIEEAQLRWTEKNGGTLDS